MKVLVTGATGFVGGAVARALVNRGIEVRVLARGGSDLQNLQGLTVERVEGDLRDQTSLRKALTGCRQLYHVAAHYALWAKDPSIFYDVNVTDTKTLLEAARTSAPNGSSTAVPSERSAFRRKEGSATKRPPLCSSRWPATTNDRNTWQSKRS